MSGYGVTVTSVPDSDWVFTEWGAGLPNLSWAPSQIFIPTQGFLGDWSKATLPDQYGVRGIPEIFLIGPDGKIAARDLRCENIKPAVSKALAK